MINPFKAHYNIQVLSGDKHYRHLVAVVQREINRLLKRGYDLEQAKELVFKHYGFDENTIAYTLVRE